MTEETHGPTKEGNLCCCFLARNCFSFCYHHVTIAMLLSPPLVVRRTSLTLLCIILRNAQSLSASAGSLSRAIVVRREKKHYISKALVQFRLLLLLLLQLFCGNFWQQQHFFYVFFYTKIRKPECIQCSVHGTRMVPPACHPPNAPCPVVTSPPTLAIDRLSCVSWLRWHAMANKFRRK